MSLFSLWLVSYLVRVVVFWFLKVEVIFELFSFTECQT